MNKNQYSKLRKIHRVFLYVFFATIGLLMLAGAAGAAGIFDLGDQNQYEKMGSYIAVILLAAGIPYLIIGAYIVLVGSPVVFYSIDNPFLSQERLEAHFTVKLNDRHFDAPIALADEPEMKITIRRKVGLYRTRIFAIMYAHVLSASTGEQMLKIITEHLEQTSSSRGKISLTLLLCTERDSSGFSGLVRSFGQNLSLYVVPVGFNFELKTMSFLGKIDGLLAGKRKRIRKTFLSMLPEAQRYLGLDYLEGRPRKTRDQIVWPINPNKIPRGMHFLWSISCFGLAMIAFAIGVILVSNNGFFYIFFAVIVFVYAFFMIGVGVYQFKKAIVAKKRL